MLLPPSRGLRVRIVAPEGFRIESLMQREGLKRRAAERRLRELEASRSDFVRRLFRVEPDDPGLYDLIIDAASFGLEGSVDLIERALQVRRSTLPPD